VALMRIGISERLGRIVDEIPTPLAMRTVFTPTADAFYLSQG
jgi:hypothetical protein